MPADLWEVVGGERSPRNSQARQSGLHGSEDTLLQTVYEDESWHVKIDVWPSRV